MQAFLVLLLLVCCPAPLAVGQRPAGQGLCLDWVETGQKPAGVSHDGMMTLAVQAGRVEELASAVAAIAEDRSRPVAVRNRAVEVLLAALQRTRFTAFAAETQAQVATAIGHATTDPDLEPHRRGYAIAATAQLDGHPQRLAWFHEGQVQLRTLLGKTPPEARPDPAQIPGMLGYYARLDQEGLPAVDLILDLLASGALPARAVPAARACAARLAEFGDARLAGRVLAILVAHLEASPSDPRHVLPLMQRIASLHPGAFAEVDAAAALPALCRAFQVRVQDLSELTECERTWLALLQVAAQALSGPGANKGNLRETRLQCRDALAPLRNHSIPAVRDLPTMW